MTTLSSHHRPAGLVHPGQSRSAGQPRPRGLAAPLALPVSFLALMAVGAAAAASQGAVSAGWVLLLAALIVGAGSAAAEPAPAAVLAVIGWLTVIGFSRAPYAQLRPAGPHSLTAVLVIGAGAATGLGIGLLARRVAARFTLFVVRVPLALPPGDALSTKPSASATPPVSETRPVSVTPPVNETAPALADAPPGRDRVSAGARPG